MSNCSCKRAKCINKVSNMVFSLIAFIECVCFIHNFATSKAGSENEAEVLVHTEPDGEVQMFNEVQSSADEIQVRLVKYFSLS